LYHLATISIACAITACGGSDGGSTGPTNGGTGNSRFTAKIDGVAWASDAGAERVGVPITLPGLYTMTGIKLGAGGYTLIFTLSNIPGPGTYPLGVGISVPGGNVLISTTAGGWRTPQTGADGSITITTLTASRIEGTFNFTAVPFTGSVTGTKTVTDGSFALDVKPTGAVGALPENAGHKVSATLNGVAFNAADASGSYSASNSGILSIVGTNNTRALSITLAGIAANATGTFALGSGATPRTMSLSLINGSQSAGAYSSSVAGGSGSVTITSFTATRIKGTFTATLGAALAPATGTMSVTSGTFDIGRP
jgi:hypothetical protein